MSLDEKIALLHGARDPDGFGQAGYWPGLPRLGIAPLRLADGPPGVNVNQDSTAMPAPIALAATFSAADARRYGAVLGREARALGQDILLAPHINIIRDPLFRRNHTTFSEDPFLTAQLARAEIAGIQSQGVMAQVKHLAGYNGPDNVLIDERTLHEIYLPAFEASVDAGVASLMCAYNRVNGPWSCESGTLQNDILRGLWGFQGFVTSDWGAVHSPLAIVKGLDQEMPGREIAGWRGGPHFAAGLKAELATGAVKEADIDRALARVLSQMERFQLLRRRPRRRERIDVEADARAVLQVAARSAVLLRNERQTLPLGPADLASLAVIGPTAGQLAAGLLGERGYGFEARLVSPLDALKRSAPQARIRYSPGVDLTGVPIPATALAAAAPGLNGSLTFEGAGAVAAGDFTWSGLVRVPEAGEYTFLVQPALDGGSEGGGSLSIDGRPVARTGGPGFDGSGVRRKKWSSLLPTTDGRDNGRGAVHLAAGVHRLEIVANSIGEAPLGIRYSWITPEMRREAIRSAAALAREAHTVVVFAWHGAGSTLTLEEDQDELIRQVVAANRRVAVVLNTGGPVAMPWRDSVSAILQMWLPGQEGGWATANLLLGRSNPAGKLPVTFPVRLEDAPSNSPANPERRAPARQPGPADPAALAVTFSEGLAVGYRWYDQQGIEPLFAFGHGLSYTRFEYSNLRVTRTPLGAEVSFRLRNAGSRSGAEVAQLYLGPSSGTSVPMPPKSLAAFKRVELRPGHSANVTVVVGARAFSYWSTERHAWEAAAGERPIYVGSSSRDIRLKGRAASIGVGRN